MEMILATLKNIYYAHVNETALTQNLETEVSDYHKNRILWVLNIFFLDTAGYYQGISRFTER